MTFRPEFQPPWASITTRDDRRMKRLRQGGRGILAGCVAGDVIRPAEIVAKLSSTATACRYFCARSYQGTYSERSAF